MSKTRQFKQVDVFTQSAPFQGNPVAVFFSASHLSDEDMQRVANWTNLSETTFVLPATNPNPHTYRLRIFTTAEELPFAGHPTIGSAHALIEAGLITPDENGKVYQECKAGLVELTVKGDGVIRFKLPYYRHTVHETDSELVKEIANALGTDFSEIKHAVLVDDGPLWFTIQFKSGELVRKLQYDATKISEIFTRSKISGLSLFGKFSSSDEIIENSLTYEARNLFGENDNLLVEDPVCGSGAGADASVLGEYENFEGDFIIRQGRNVSRDGIVRVKVAKKKEGGNDIFVGGRAVTIIDGMY